MERKKDEKEKERERKKEKEKKKEQGKIWKTEGNSEMWSEKERER